MNYKFLVVSADETMIKCKTLGGIMQVSHFSFQVLIPCGNVAVVD